tara:strand:- start:1178 stop:1561 length:384 start_codon:yes stop_codon:yes gene_type:complete
MGQRVNIQYSVELSDLDSEVNRLFDLVLGDLEAIAKGWGQGNNVVLDLSGIQMIDEVRQTLTRADVALGDIQKIVQGYVQFKSAPPQQEEVPDLPSEAEELELQQKIARFKEMLSEVPNQESEKQDQ